MYTYMCIHTPLGTTVRQPLGYVVAQVPGTIIYSEGKSEHLCNVCNIFLM